jgi:DNA (cytosine-5)-methyltransferase 1
MPSNPEWAPMLTAVSTFSGAGGSCVGYEQAGYDVVWANEFIPAAAATYTANHPTTILDTRDIRSITPGHILKTTMLKRGEIDLLDGSPPCAAFSTGGARSANWGKTVRYSDTKQRTDDLFDEFVRILDGLQPKTFVAENVPGLARGPAAGYFKHIHAALEACGYRVKAMLVDASRLGVPQARRRIIFAGVRRDLGRDPVFPVPGKPVPMSTVLGRQAVLWVNNPRNKNATWDRIPATRPCPTVQAIGIHGRAIAQTCLTGVPHLTTDPEVGVSLHQTYPNLLAEHPHPHGARVFSIGELKALCGFPATYILTGTYAQRWERLGRAVPPPMMRAIATSLKENVLSVV